ncbi:hypothetical protein BT67DRAFT_38403 [Trichocladium antarcticum]|uniref:Uncharacterized protein n=1 Tax=Trichocladium antarcticum TaxID=1450529 RepID=A0AAN6UJ06_9PEZI|nr:hypothetical protein BT67DRAFT_38403 [Trichocladium antarcticum]
MAIHAIGREAHGAAEGMAKKTPRKIAGTRFWMRAPPGQGALPGLHGVPGNPLSGSRGIFRLAGIDLRHASAMGMSEGLGRIQVSQFDHGGGAAGTRVSGAAYYRYLFRQAISMARMQPCWRPPSVMSDLPRQPKLPLPLLSRASADAGR